MRMPPFQPVWKNPPSRAEIRIIEELYAVGDGAPAIRRQVLGARLGLDVADQLEEMGIYDASAMTLQDTRELLKLAGEQLAEEEKEAAKPTGKEAGATVDDSGQTPRALPAIAAVLAKAAPVVLKSAPKLAKLTKLTKVFVPAEAWFFKVRATVLVRSIIKAPTPAHCRPHQESKNAFPLQHPLDSPVLLFSITDTHVTHFAAACVTLSGCLTAIKGLYEEQRA